MINYCEEFNRQWEMLESAMFAEMKNLEKASGLQIERINEVYQDEQNRWRTPSQGNYSWLEMLRRTHPPVAVAFESELYALRLTEEESSEQVSKDPRVPTIVTGCCGAAAGYAVASILSPWSVSANLAVGVAVGALAGWCINSRTAKQTGGLREQIIDNYMQQLAVHGKALKDILAAIE